MKPKPTLITLLLIVVLSGALGVVGTVWLQSRPRPLETIIERPETIQFLRDILKLGVVEVRLSQIYEVKRDNLIVSHVAIPWTGQHSVIAVSGTGMAGYDLEQLDIKILREKREIMVQLPPPTILFVNIDFRDLQEEDTFLNRLTTEDRNNIRKQLKAEAVKSLLTDNVKLAVTKRTDDLLNGLGVFLGYRITNQEPLLPKPTPR